MAVTVTWVEWVSAETPGTEPHDTFTFKVATDTPATITSATNLNFGNVSSRDLTPSSYPIAAGSNSYSKFIKLNFSGSFTAISNGKLWKSAGAYVTDEYIWHSGSVEMATPAAATATIFSGEPDVEWTDYGVGRRIPTSQPSNNNVILRYGGTSESTLPDGTLPDAASSPDYYSGSRSALMAFQLTSSASTPAGAVNQKTISLTYDRA